MMTRKAKTPEAKARQLAGLRPKTKKLDPANFKKSLCLSERQIQKINNLSPEKIEAILLLLPESLRKDRESGLPLETWQAIVRAFVESWPD